MSEATECLVSLPWPPKHCWPNSRSRSWHKGWRAKKTARFAAKVLTLDALQRRTWPAGGTVAVAITMLPPSMTLNGRRATAVPDRDNCIAACKAYLDGVADALGVNDRLFRVTSCDIDDKRVEGGGVRLHLSHA